jgi:hypothetical protein
MSKHIKTVMILGLALFLLSGCTMGMTPIQGMFFTDFEGPLMVGSAAGFSKVGVAEGMVIVGVGRGDVSISTAMKNGGIKKIHHVDYHTQNIMGVFSRVQLKVYGE